MIKVNVNQNILDFILQNTGSISNLMSFLQTNKISYKSFNNIKSFNLVQSNNDTVKNFKKYGITIANKIKSVGDFNNDFNSDFNNQ